MRTLRRDLLFGAGLVLFLLGAVWAAFFVTSQAVNQLLHEDAEAAGEAWARYLAANVKDLPLIVAGENPSADSMSFFERAQQVGDVFLYKIFDANGGLRLSSDKLEEIGKVAESILVHNPKAAALVLRGEIEIEAKEGKAPNRPAFYSEAYVPVVIGSRIVGIVEAYVDQSAKRAAFNAGISSVAAALAGIIAVAFGLPAFGFYWRTRQKRQADFRADFLAKHDALTEVLNRSRFMHDLHEAISFGCPIVVHSIDINRFKDINDTLGASAGDEILRQLARRLRALSNKQDLLARLGGDEFALAEVVHGPGQVTKTARRIVSTLGETYHLNDREVELSVCVGSAVAPAHGQDAATLLKNAEIALSHSKGEGPGSRSLFRPQMEAELQARREIEAMLRSAVAKESFELVFQPIRRASDRRLAGFEALLRLPREGGQVSPAVFVPLAERLGLIDAIGDWVLRHACAVAATWPGPLSIAVNLSPVQFQDGKIGERVRRALDASGLDANRLELEITEGLLLSNPFCHAPACRTENARGAHRHGRFRHRLFEPQLSLAFPIRQAEDRPVLHPRAGRWRRASRIGDPGHRRARALARHDDHSGGGGDGAAFLRHAGCHQLQGFHLGRPMPLDKLAGEILGDFRAALPQDEAETAAELVARGT